MPDGDNARGTFRGTQADLQVSCSWGPVPPVREVPNLTAVPSQLCVEWSQYYQPVKRFMECASCVPHRLSKASSAEILQTGML